MTSQMQRVRELAVQSANASNSAADRLALDAEGQQLVAEVQRVTNRATFNGMNLLDGSFASRLFQVGGNTADVIGSTIADAQLASVAGYVYGNVGSPSGPVTAGAVTIDVGGGPIAIPPSGGNGLNDRAFWNSQAINAAGIPGVTATVSNVKAYNPMTGPGVIAGVNDGLVGVANKQPGDQYFWTLILNGIQIYQGPQVDMSVSQIASMIQAQYVATHGVSASVNASGQLELSGQADIQLSEMFNITDASDGLAKPTYHLGSVVSPASFSGGEVPGPHPLPDGFFTAGIGGTNSQMAHMTINSDHAIVFGGTDPNPAALMGISAMPTIPDFSLATAQQALDTITAADKVLGKYAAARAYLGAMQNRLGSAAANALASSQGAAATRSRIADADFATETANFSRAMILRQTGMALAAQANSEPRLVLALLKNLG
jgi:flagellin